MAEDKDTINVQVSMKNKKDLELIRQNLERVHMPKRFSLDKTIHHILKIYKIQTTIQKRKGNYKQMLQKL